MVTDSANNNVDDKSLHGTSRQRSPDGTPGPVNTDPDSAAASARAKNNKPPLPSWKWNEQQRGLFFELVKLEDDLMDLYDEKMSEF